MGNDDCPDLIRTGSQSSRSADQRRSRLPGMMNRIRSPLPTSPRDASPRWGPIQPGAHPHGCIGAANVVHPEGVQGPAQHGATGYNVVTGSGTTWDFSCLCRSGLSLWTVDSRHPLHQQNGPWPAKMLRTPGVRFRVEGAPAGARANGWLTGHGPGRCCALIAAGRTITSKAPGSRSKCPV